MTIVSYRGPDLVTLDRRAFMKWFAAASSLALPGCRDPARYTEEDAARLDTQRRRERERSGRGPFGPRRYRGYRGLAELPWFELDAQGRLRCVAEDVPPALDIHAHLGMSLLLAPEIDLQARTARVRHILDCDATDPGCPLDLDVYINANFRPEDLRALRRAAVTQMLWGNAAAQRFFPDAPEAMPIYEECARLGLPVVFHGGRAGIEPAYTHQFTLMRHYEGALRRFPELPFVIGHAGARDVADAIPLAQRNPNAWLGIHGQGVTTLHELIERVGADRLLFGSDWPFYHLAATLAKVLIVTEGRPDDRYAILRGNADRLLGVRH